MTDRDIKLPVELIHKYGEALEASIKFAPQSEKALYKLHIQELRKLETLIASGASIEDIATQLRSERRSFGWSFLSGNHGEQVERAFHEFASDIERQIIRKRGKDWYYSVG